jgi:hypothetical protein
MNRRVFFKFIGVLSLLPFVGRFLPKQTVGTVCVDKSFYEDESWVFVERHEASSFDWRYFYGKDIS